MNDTLKSILSRRSVRSFKDTLVSKDDVSLIVKAGIYAPTACNRQPLFIVGIASEDKVKEVKDIIGGGKQFYGASAIIMVFKRNEDDFSEIDCGAAMENMLLASHSLGLSSCWIHCVRDLYNDPKNNALLMKALGLKKSYSLMESIALGYIQGDEPLPKPRNMQGDNVI
jgi:nitroreductase